MCTGNSAEVCEGVSLETLANGGHIKWDCPAANIKMYQHLARHRKNRDTLKLDLDELLGAINCIWPGTDYATLVNERVLRRLKSLFQSLVDNGTIVDAKSGRNSIAEWPRWTEQWLEDTWLGDIRKPSRSAVDVDPTIIGPGPMSDGARPRSLSGWTDSAATTWIDPTIVLPDHDSARAAMYGSSWLDPTILRSSYASAASSSSPSTSNPTSVATSEVVSEHADYLHGAAGDDMDDIESILCDTIRGFSLGDKCQQPPRQAHKGFALLREARALRRQQHTLLASQVRRSFKSAEDELARLSSQLARTTADEDICSVESRLERVKEVLCHRLEQWHSRETTERDGIEGEELKELGWSREEKASARGYRIQLARLSEGWREIEGLERV